MNMTPFQELIYRNPGNYTFAMIKPNNSYETITNVNNIINQNFDTYYGKVERKFIDRLSLKDVRFLYYKLIDTPIFEDLANYMMSGDCTFYMLSSKNNSKDTVEKWRNLMGCTDSSKADPDTIRYKYGDHEVIRENVVHGSDSNERAFVELMYFFGGWRNVH